MSQVQRYECIRLEPADKGWILSYDEIRKPVTNGTYDSPSYMSKKEVYEDDDFVEAMVRMKALAMYNKGNENDLSKSMETIKMSMHESMMGGEKKD